MHAHRWFVLGAIVLFGSAACEGGGAAPDASIIIVPDAPVDAGVALPDAPAAVDLTCAGAALPTIAIDPATLGGSAQTVNVMAMAIEPVVGASVRAFEAHEDHFELIAMATTGADGAYSLSVPTGGRPLAGYLHAAKPNLRDVYAFPATPYVASDTGGFLFMLDAQLWGYLSSDQEQPGNGSIVVVAVDCAGAPIAGATFTATQAGAAVGITQYADSSQGFPLPGDAAATDASGTAYIFDVPPGATTIATSAMGTQLRANIIRSVAQSTTTTTVVP